MFWQIFICLRDACCFREKTENEKRIIDRLKNDLIELTEEEFNHLSNTVIIPMQTRAYNKYCCHKI